MNSTPSLTFLFTYDGASLLAATRFRYKMYWKRLLPWTIGLIVLMALTIILLVKVKSTDLLWFPVVYLLGTPILWATTWLKLRSKLLKKTGKSVEIQLNAEGFTMKSDGEVHTWPWARFKTTLRDSCNIYLFLTKRAALVIPSNQLSQEVLDSLLARGFPSGRV